MHFSITQTTLSVESPHCCLFCDVKTARIIEIFTSLDYLHENWIVHGHFLSNQLYKFNFIS